MTDNKRIIALSNQLREEGMQVSIRSTKTACDVWNLLKGTTSLTNLQTALKVFISRIITIIKSLIRFLMTYL